MTVPSALRTNASSPASAIATGQASSSGCSQRVDPSRTSYATSHPGARAASTASAVSTGVTVMPATIIWGVDCGDTGLSVTFGSGGGDTDNGLVLQLTSVAISDDKCMRIALAIGETVLAITKGN